MMSATLKQFIEVLKAYVNEHGRSVEEVLSELAIPKNDEYRNKGPWVLSESGKALRKKLSKAKKGS